MAPASHARRPRTAAFIPRALVLPRRAPRRRPARCAAQPARENAASSSPLPPPTSPSRPTPPSAPTAPSALSAPDASDAVKSHLESSRTRVRLLQSRALVRAGEAGIRLGKDLLAGPSASDASVEADMQTIAGVLGQLKRDLRALRRAADELEDDDPATIVIGQLEEVVKAVARRVARPKVGKGAAAHEEVEDRLEGPVGVVEDTQWVADGGEGEEGGAEGGQFVEVVRRKVAEGGDALKRKATNVGAGIEERVAGFVTDDGSIDVEGLRAFVGRLLDNAGMTWKRLNGAVPQGKTGEEGEAMDVQYASLSVKDSEKEFELREEIGHLEKKLIASSKEREGMLRKEDQLGKLIRAKEIRSMDDGVSALRRTLAVRVLQLEMEKIFVSVADEIENSDYQTMMEQRVLVAEFGDLDERLATLELFVQQDEPLLIDDDVLGELAADIQDLKTRLGLDEALYSAATLSWQQVRQFAASSVKKSREGAEFYSRGMRLFAGDMRFAMRLVRRAIVGYTPSPREIRTIRRTGRDLLTLIPFTIVLIAPLTPVGHVLIFGFLQRYWPEFFPSTFTERRQSVMKRHEQYAKALREEEGDEMNGLGEGVEGSDDGKGGSRKSVGGGLFGLRRLLLFGRVGDDKATKSDAPAETEVAVSRVAGNDGQNGATSDAETTEGNVENGSPRIALSDLADSAAGSEKIAKKKRNAAALEELHLAD